MNSIHYLYAAYLATWAIHGTYLVILARKYRGLHREMEELKQKFRSQAGSAGKRFPTS
jgi:CcmD family protein